MQKFPANPDLQVFITVVRKGGFAAAAEELGVSPAYISKRVRLLEQELGTPLLHRTTRRVAVTEAGERVYHLAQGVLDQLDQLVQGVRITQQIPRGSLRISSSFGFGRNIVAPAISALRERYPTLQVRLEVFDRLVDVATEGYDLDFRVGDDIAPHLIARRLGANKRILCASPKYLRERGTPRVLSDLLNHDCLVIKERDHPFGVWRLRAGAKEETVKVTGSLSTNNGEIALGWAVEGRGILLRSLWNIEPAIRSGKLVHILPDYCQEANFWAVYPSRLDNSAKVRVTVEFMDAYLRKLQASHEGRYLP
ncbi:LysR family transcriptional regulator [Pigmentiphaga soli]|uniref:LysR family transcriptional regulator n=1 Tax=Pigmentiphaga soli TaxID=1007095 RepID=A0ABP8HNL6_9BURK